MQKCCIQIEIEFFPPVHLWKPQTTIIDAGTCVGRW